MHMGFEPIRARMRHRQAIFGQVNGHDEGALKTEPQGLGASTRTNQFLGYLDR